MATEARFAVVVVAGGRGQRFGGDTPKQLLDLCGRPVWRRSVDSFLRRADVSQVVLVRPEGAKFGDDVPGLDCVIGGDSRAASVAAGLAAVNDAPLTAVHDAARPLISTGEVDRIFAAAAERGAVVPGHPVAGTVRRARDGVAGETVDRQNLYEMQTPQVARTDWLRDAVALASPAETFTDEGEFLMRAGREVAVVETSATNFKITSPADLDLARVIWAARTASDNSRAARS